MSELIRSLNLSDVIFSDMDIRELIFLHLFHILLEQEKNLHGLHF